MITLAELVLSFVIIIILVVMAVLSLASATAITKVSNFKSNSDLLIAHDRLTVAGISLWVGIIVIVAVIIYYIHKSSQNKESGIYIKLFMFIALVLAFIAGILASIASVKMDEAKNSGIENTTARSLSNTVAVLGVLVGVLGIVGIIYLIYHTRAAKKKAAKAAKAKKAE